MVTGCHSECYKHFRFDCIFVVCLNWFQLIANVLTTDCMCVCLLKYVNSTDSCTCGIPTFTMSKNMHQGCTHICLLLNVLNACSVYVLCITSFFWTTGCFVYYDLQLDTFSLGHNPPVVRSVHVDNINDDTVPEVRMRLEVVWDSHSDIQLTCKLLPASVQRYATFSLLQDTPCISIILFTELYWLTLLT